MVVCCPLGFGEELLDASRYGYTNHPPEEALEVDYDPWAAYEGPDRSGKLGARNAGCLSARLSHQRSLRGA